VIRRTTAPVSFDRETTIAEVELERIAVRAFVCGIAVDRNRGRGPSPATHAVLGDRVDVGDLSVRVAATEKFANNGPILVAALHEPMFA